MANVEINLPQTWKCRGEILSGTRITYVADSIIGPDITVLGGVKKQQAAVPVTKAKVLMFYILASAEVTMQWNGTNEVQTVTISATGGTFTLTFSGQTTSAIAWNASAATVQTALQALSSIGSGNATVTGSAGGPYTVTFVGDLGLSNVAAMTGSGASLTGGAGTVTIATPTPGVAPDATWVLKAGYPESWDSQSSLFASNPMPNDLVNLWITNAGTTSSSVQVRFGVSL